jgi:hypothetical protein
MYVCMYEEKQTFDMNVSLSFEMTCSSERVHLIYNEIVFFGTPTML